MKIVALVSILLLAPMALWAAEEAAPAPAPQVAANAQALFQPADALLAASLTPSPQYTPTLNCDRYNNQYCTYAWNKIYLCCELTYQAPGANCSPRICI